MKHIFNAPNGASSAVANRAPSKQSRRFFLLGAMATALAGCQRTGRDASLNPGLGQGGNANQIPDMYQARPKERFPLPAIKAGDVPRKFWRKLVKNPTGERAGTLVVDTPNKYLYWVMEDGKAMRYGIGVGRQGFSWSGRARMAWKRAWPTWTPPSEMIDRQPELEKWRKGMPPGLGNPLGARALYIYEGGRDTLYRLHGTNEPRSIGKAVSSGCIRLLNQDIIDLYNRVPKNTPIVVIQDPKTALKDKDSLKATT